MRSFSFAWSNLLGYDLFISYRRSEALAYAERLHRELRAAGLTVFLDRDETPGGADLTPALKRALRRSRMLVLLLTPEVLQSEWVQEEVRTFSALRGRAIVPVNIDGYVQKHALEGTALANIPGYSWIEESLEALHAGVPSEDVVQEVLKGRSKVRVRTISRAIVTAVIAVLLLTTAFALMQMREAQVQAGVALTGQMAAQAELVRLQDPQKLASAAALAGDSMSRLPSLQAERTIRAALEGLPVLSVSFAIGPAVGIAFTQDELGILAASEKSQTIAHYDRSGRKLGVVFECPPAAVCAPELKSGLVAVATQNTEGGSHIEVRKLVERSVVAAIDWPHAVAALLTDPVGQRLFARNAANRGCLWTLKDGRQTGCFDAPAGATWQFNANGQLLAAEIENDDDDEDLLDLWRVWRADTGAEVGFGGSGGIGSSTLLLSSTGRYVVSMRKGYDAVVHDLERNRQLPPFRHADTVTFGIFDGTDTLLVTSGDEYNVRTWLLEDEAPDAGRLPTPGFRDQRLERFTADGLGIVTSGGGDRGGAIRVWRYRTTAEGPTLEPRLRVAHDSSVKSFDLTRDDASLATLDDKGTVRIWDCRDGNIVSATPVDSWDAWDKAPKEGPAPAPSISVWTRLRAWASGLWSRDSASSSAAALDEASQSAARVTSPTGAHTAVTSESSSDRAPGSVTIYDTARKRPVATISHSAKVNDARFSRDGRFLATAGADQAIRIWDIEANRQVSEIHTSASIDKVRFVDGDRYVEALSEDGRGRVVITRFRWKVDDLLSALAARKEQLRRES